MILHTLHHCLFGSFVQNLLLNRQSFILTTNATMQVFTLRYLYMLAKGDVEMLYAASSVSRGKHSLHCIIEHEYMARGSLHSFEFNFSRVRRVWFSAGSAPITPVLFVCIFLVILAPVSSSAHYLLQLFPRSDFFFTQ